RAAGGPRARPARARRPGGGRDGRHRGERLHRSAADDRAGRQGGDGAPGRPAPDRAHRGGAPAAGGGAGDGRAGGPGGLRGGGAGRRGGGGGAGGGRRRLGRGGRGARWRGGGEGARVLGVLESQSLYRHYGPRPLRKVAELEQGFARSMEVRHALAVTSGTGALIVGLAALGIGPGDEVIVPTYTWVATINAVVMPAAVPAFVDIDWICPT